jgi:hypothetical protein
MPQYSLLYGKSQRGSTRVRWWVMPTACTWQGRRIWERSCCLHRRRCTRCPVNWKYALGGIAGGDVEAAAPMLRPPLVADHRPAAKGDTSATRRPGTVWRRSDSLLGLATSRASSVRPLGDGGGECCLAVGCSSTDPIPSLFSRCAYWGFPLMYMKLTSFC